MKRFLLLFSALFCVGLLPTVTLGQGTITSGSATWEWVGTTGSANFNVNAAGDHLFRQWWWQRNAGLGSAGTQVIYPAPTTQTYMGAVATLTWSDPNFDHELLATISNNGNTASVLQEMTVTNLSSSQQTIRLYAYSDFDVLGSGGDSAVHHMGDPDHIRVSDGAAYSDLLGFDATRYEVDAYPALANNLDSPSNYALSNSGIPFGPADFTGAFQWNRMVPAGASITVYMVYTYSETAQPPVVLPPPDTFVRGDCNSDMSTNLVDAIFLLGFLFPQGTPNALTCDDACDANDDGSLNLVDAIALLNALFGQPIVPLPGPLSCDADPTMDMLTCDMPTC